MYWLYPSEQFHSRLDDTYHDDGATSSKSWLCSLYSIFALGAAADSAGEDGLLNGNFSEGISDCSDTKTSLDYLAFAKQLVPQVYDEADIDSIRALAILSLALQSFGFRVASYLHTGTCVQIAYSLGLQHDKSPASQSLVTRQQNRRIWWTIYTLDQEIASWAGNACVIDERSLNIHTPLPSEQVMNPGTNTPLGCLAVSVSLCRLKRQIVQAIYPEQTTDSRKISFSQVSTFISSLEQWLSALPSHLNWGVPSAPTHRRAIATLHLNYWSAMMLLTRPFLFYSVMRSSCLTKGKKLWFEKLAETCIHAAANTMSILKTMSSEKTLSSLTTFDALCALKVIMIFILALAKSNSGTYRTDIDLCLTLLRSMEQIGFCSSVVTELPIHLAKLNVTKWQDEAGDTSDETSNALVSQFWPDFDYSSSFMPFVENMQNLDSIFGDTFSVDMDITFDVSPGGGFG